MQDLIQQERFELEVLERLNSRKMLTKLVFAGGSMLRLCYGLNRFSVDLDFWLVKKVKLHSTSKCNVGSKYLGRSFVV
jgi:predicted nucleotidyltransferase component of viral defense system